MNSCFVREFNYVATVRANSRPVLYKKNIVGIPQKEVFLAYKEGVTLSCPHKERGDTGHPENSRSFENVAGLWYSG